ncbi:hypothetical protein AKJ09_06460 [Labilithrix luteola]|uniref:Uncharacterized protein n=1 Tax=Labilithrix luteola TaxID=1391654 RepID=A0A0K1Q2D0_9BACT|nr:hypothetical protein AKJ09_06460 [Labilithrix luteola]
MTTAGRRVLGRRGHREGHRIGTGAFRPFGHERRGRRTAGRLRAS